MENLLTGKVASILTNEYLYVLNSRFSGESPEKITLGFRKKDVTLIRRDGRLGVFLTHSLIFEEIEKQRNIWIENFSKGLSLPELALACAHFFRNFISIHPFSNGNGRTAKEMLRQLLQLNGLAVFDFFLIDRYLFTNDIEKDLSELKNLFLFSINPVCLEGVGNSDFQPSTFERNT